MSESAELPCCQCGDNNWNRLGDAADSVWCKTCGRLLLGQGPPLDVLQRPDIVSLLRNIGNTVAQHISPKAGAWCSFCQEAKQTELDVIKTSFGAAICRACVRHASDVFAERVRLDASEAKP